MFSIKTLQFGHHTDAQLFGCDKSFWSNHGIPISDLRVYLDERHTSEYITGMLIKNCDDWGFNTDKVSAVVTDNAVNMVKAVEIAFEK